MDEKSGKGGKCQSLSFLALALSRFNPIRLALCALRQIKKGENELAPSLCNVLVVRDYSSLAFSTFFSSSSLAKPSQEPAGHTF